MGIIGRFRNRIETLVTTKEDKKVEEAHAKKALKQCGHPTWVLNRKRKNKNKKEEKVANRKSSTPIR